MIGYTTVGTNDLARARSFYDALFASIGGKRVFDSDRGTGWGVAMDKPMFAAMLPFDGKAATVGNGTMIALVFKTPDQVKALYDQALALGGSDEGAPGPRGTSGFYGAYFRDLDGNKLCAFCYA